MEMHSRKYTSGSIQVTNTVVEPFALAVTPWGTEGTEKRWMGKDASEMNYFYPTNGINVGLSFLIQMELHFACPHHQQCVGWADHWMVQRPQWRLSQRKCTGHQGSDQTALPLWCCLLCSQRRLHQLMTTSAHRAKQHHWGAEGEAMSVWCCHWGHLQGRKTGWRVLRELCGKMWE